MFYLKRDRNLCVCVCVCVSSPLPNSCLSHPVPREARCFTSVMSFTFRHAAGLRCEFAWRRLVSWFFTLKIVGAVTGRRLDAPWFAGTVALAGLIWALPWSILGVFGIERGTQGARVPALGPGHPPAPSVSCSPRPIPSRMVYGVCQHEQRNTPPGGGNLDITVPSLQSPPCHQERLRGNPDTALPKPLEMLLSCSQLLQLAGDHPKDELSRNGLASLGGTRGGGLRGSDAERGPSPEDAGGCRQPPLPRAQGGQRSSRHQREGLNMTPPPGTNRQPATVVFGLSWRGAAL